MKYYKQETDKTCAVACFRMMLSHFFEDIPTEKELLKKLKFHKQTGVNSDNIIALAKEFGLMVIAEENGTIERITTLRNEGYVVMLAISVNVPHMVIYLEHLPDYVLLNDPFFGEDIMREKKLFLSDDQKYPFHRWRISDEDVKKYSPDYDSNKDGSYRLFIAIKK